VDGNKRTAFLCLIRFLEANGFEIQADDDQLYQFTVDVASSTIDKEHVAQWIQTRTKTIIN
jgi:death-on-curing family protein